VDKSIVNMWDDEHRRMVTRASRNYAPESLATIARLLTQRTGRERPSSDDFRVHANVPGTVAGSPAEEMVRREGIESGMDVPIVSGGRVLGGFGVSYTRPHAFTDPEQRMLLALADRAAAAIQNAELYERAQQAASLEERQRLARELHDSVSQALYGIALGARTARTLLDRDPQKAAEPVDYVLSLAEAGLTEMRALIFELRPESLETEGLVAALEKQVAAARARYGLSVDANLCPEPDAPLDVKEAVYRVAQEALHNVVKHARARNVQLRLAFDRGELTLEVEDDGAGFDPAGEFPGHMGLTSMRERIVRVAGEIEITSAPGRGTKVRAWVPISAAAAV
jgi:signal transduction histidine kinase